MATYSISYGTATALTVSGLASLTNGSSATSNARDNAIDLNLDDLVEVVIVAGASGTSTTGTVEVWVGASVDGTNFGDASNRKLLGILNVVANSGTYRKVFSVGDAFGGQLPMEYQITIKNSSGGTLAASGSSVKYQGVKMTSS